MKDSITKENLELIANYYLHDLSAEEHQQLEKLIAEDSEFRSVFAEMGRDEWLLHHVHHMEGTKIIHMNPRKIRRRKIRALAAGIAVLATLGTLLWTKSATISEIVTAKKGRAVVATVANCYVLQDNAISVVNEGKVRQLDNGDKLRSGDRIVVPPGCRLDYQYLGEETVVKMSGGTYFQVVNRDGAKHIRLDQGHMYAEVEKQAEGKPMLISTRDAQAVVLGTSFEILADEITRLSVITGRVRFTSNVDGQSVVVGAGNLADTGSDEKWKANTYRSVELKPIEDRSINFKSNDEFILVDPVRKSYGFIKFDLSHIEGEILEAKLRLKVMNTQMDYGGNGHVRLFTVPPETPLSSHAVQIANYIGKVGGGMDLDFDIDPADLKDEITAFKISLDKKGNDFWFSSSRGSSPPVLELKIVEKQ